MAGVIAYAMALKIASRALIGFVLAAALACSNPGSPSNGTGTTVNGQTLDLTVDGTPFQPANVTVTSSSTPDVLLIAASDRGSGNAAQSITISVPSRVGVYPIGSNSNPVVRLQRGPLGLEVVWAAYGPVGSGTIEITSRGSSTAEGRVNVTLAADGPGAGATAKVCVGTFTVRF